jgi:hypothetical protein
MRALVGAIFMLVNFYSWLSPTSILEPKLCLVNLHQKSTRVIETHTFKICYKKHRIFYGWLQIISIHSLSRVVFIFYYALLHDKYGSIFSRRLIAWSLFCWRMNDRGAEAGRWSKIITRSSVSRLLCFPAGGVPCGVRRCGGAEKNIAAEKWSYLLPPSGGPLSSATPSELLSMRHFFLHTLSPLFFSHSEF